MATLLIVVMLGLVVTAAAFGTWHALGGAQARQLTVHATAPAQATAWRGVELVRRYLEAVDGPVIAAWGREGAPLAIGGDLGITARITEVVEVPGSAMVGPYYRVTAQVSGLAAAGTAAQSTSAVEVVYRVVPGDGGGSTPGPGPGSGMLEVLDIHQDLNLTGSIAFTGPEGAVINVDGNAVLGSASITGIDTLRATGNVSVGSGIQVGAVHANGDVELTGSAGAAEIRSRGNVTVRGGARPLSVRANGLVQFTGGNGSVVESRGGVKVTGGGVNISAVATEGAVDWSGSGLAGTIHANGNISYAGSKNAGSPTLRTRGDLVVSGAGAGLAHANGSVRGINWGTLDTVAARKDVSISGSVSGGTVRTAGNTRMEGSGNLGQLDGQGDLYVSGWQAVSGVIGGRLQKAQAGNGNVRVTVSPGHKVTVEDVAAVSIPEVPEIRMPAYSIDVVPLRAAANYVFEYVDGRIQVTVSQVSGIPDGAYVLGDNDTGSGKYKDWLCRPGDLRGGTCARPVATLCQGHSPYNACFAYSAGKWTLNGTSMARGVAWFDGDLALGNGTYVNTFAATGNITTSGSHRTVSPNYAGYAAVCTNAAPAGTGLQPNPDFARLVPTNLCDTTRGQMTGDPLGNIAYVAGAVRPGGFVGGDISLGASTRADGAVLAGNLLSTGGSTTLNGRIVSAAQRAKSGDAVKMGGSTAMNLGSGSHDYEPGATPCMVNCEPEPPPGEATEGNTASIQWSRYL
ncbi:FapA family protein [Lysobacter sp. GX 14042]|uniref:FapA family protein n=1 Tax=Lysobacter sp. GX 14042 TaxID=2907155 RepID=UPI001F29CAD9|nr:FapA family protein [Lysobacter sp. GX 14042]MCE7031171.1 FapA family protein [Lysobacter sp. GX 14042]